MRDSNTKPTTRSTTGSGAPAPNDRNSLTMGSNRPIMLHDVHLLEQMAHFNREKVPERQPHAKGAGAFGVFEATKDMSAYTKAALFQKGASTEMLARFSTVAGEAESPVTWRDVREVFNAEQRSRLVEQVAGSLLGGVRSPVLEHALEYWKSIDADTGRRIEEKALAAPLNPLKVWAKPDPLTLAGETLQAIEKPARPSVRHLFSRLLYQPKRKRI